MDKPVALFIFKRPELTQKVLNAIRQAQPKQLLVVADGPRRSNQGEEELCIQTRKVIEQVDWPCEVLKNYANENMGLKLRFATGLDWVFSLVEEAIILEDDCLPHHDFFRFCEEMLDRYRDDERIGQICGSNFQFGWRRSEYSYYFSLYNHVWGWASWKRAWKDYDPNLSLWPTVKKNKWLYDLLGDQRLVRYWAGRFDRIYENRQNTWDHQWVFTGWINGRLSVIPSVNLVSNLGYDTLGVHSSTATPDRMQNQPLMPMRFPLNHPPAVIRDAVADLFFATTYKRPRWWNRLRVNSLRNAFRVQE